jgi:hypothetical protein
MKFTTPSSVTKVELMIEPMALVLSARGQQPVRRRGVVGGRGRVGEAGLDPSRDHAQAGGDPVAGPGGVPPPTVVGDHRRVRTSTGGRQVGELDARRAPRISDMVSLLETGRALRA